MLLDERHQPPERVSMDISIHWRAGRFHGGTSTIRRVLACALVMPVPGPNDGKGCASWEFDFSFSNYTPRPLIRKRRHL
jgi:hypothetical protein